MEESEIKIFIKLSEDERRELIKSRIGYQDSAITALLSWCRSEEVITEEKEEEILNIWYDMTNSQGSLEDMVNDILISVNDEIKRYQNNMKEIGDD